SLDSPSTVRPPPRATLFPYTTLFRSQSALFGQAVEAVDPGGGLLAHALDSGGEAGEASRGRLDRRGDLGQQDLVLLRVVLGGGGHSPGGFALGALEHVQGGVTAVVENEVRPVGEIEDPIGGPPVLFERLALPREHGHSGRGLGGTGADDDRCCGFVLGGEDIAAG